MRRTIEDRFWDKVQVDEERGCWLWLGSLSDGYGQFAVKGRPCRAHRFAYEHFVGPIPEGLVIDHYLMNIDPNSCSKSCVNPEHLQAVTRYENARRSPRFRITQPRVIKAIQNYIQKTSKCTYHYKDKSPEIKTSLDKISQVI